MSSPTPPTVPHVEDLDDARLAAVSLDAEVVYWRARFYLTAGHKLPAGEEALASVLFPCGSIDGAALRPLIDELGGAHLAALQEGTVPKAKPAPGGAEHRKEPPAASAGA